MEKPKLQERGASRALPLRGNAVLHGARPPHPLLLARGPSRDQMKRASGVGVAPRATRRRAQLRHLHSRPGNRAAELCASGPRGASRPRRDGARRRGVSARRSARRTASNRRAASFWNFPPRVLRMRPAAVNRCSHGLRDRVGRDAAGGAAGGQSSER